MLARRQLVDNRERGEYRAGYYAITAVFMTSVTARGSCLSTLPA